MKTYPVNGNDDRRLIFNEIKEIYQETRTLEVGVFEKNIFWSDIQEISLVYEVLQKALFKRIKANIISLIKYEIKDDDLLLKIKAYLNKAHVKQNLVTLIPVTEVRKGSILLEIITGPSVTACVYFILMSTIGEDLKDSWKTAAMSRKFKKLFKLSLSKENIKEVDNLSDGLFFHLLRKNKKNKYFVDYDHERRVVMISIMPDSLDIKLPKREKHFGLLAKDKKSNKKLLLK